MTDKAPMTNEVLAVHVDYLRQDVQTVIKGMTNMATKEDVEKISARMGTFVTTDRFDALEKKVDAGTIGSSLDRAISLVTKLGTAGTVIIAFCSAIYAVVHYYDKIKAII